MAPGTGLEGVRERLSDRPSIREDRGRQILDRPVDFLAGDGINHGNSCVLQPVPDLDRAAPEFPGPAKQLGHRHQQTDLADQLKQHSFPRKPGLSQARQQPERVPWIVEGGVGAKDVDLFVPRPCVAAGGNVITVLKSLRDRVAAHRPVQDARLGRRLEFRVPTAGPR